ncbi:hypothetical protein GJ496_010941 [Pomphorhynchus laevis]|nr:hypothetical protein GJ496_004523 [Pomphorhynchus laevis]KAI0986919.1 hypothetical protein GJ496_010941 [Pomphorhynchus laevis]
MAEFQSASYGVTRSTNAQVHSATSDHGNTNDEHQDQSSDVDTPTLAVTTRTYRNQATRLTLILSTTGDRCCLKKAEIHIRINDSLILALFDTGSSDNFIDLEVVVQLGLRAYPCNEKVSMASKAQTAVALNSCQADIYVQ